MNLPADAAGTARAMWIFCARVPADDRDMPADLYRSWLTDAEAQRLAQFSTDALRRQHLLTRALCREVLSRHHPVPAENWRFAADGHGRPTIAAPEAARGLRFSLSNTPVWVACAVVDAPGDVGIDVECVDNAAADPEIGTRYFAPREAAHLASLRGAAARHRFIALWTLKEAYAKARGLGLSLPLDRFEIDPDTVPIRLRCDPGVDVDPDGWRFDLLPLGGDHLLAVARRGCGQGSIELEVITPGAPAP